MYYDDYQATLIAQLQKLQGNRPVIDAAAQAIAEAAKSGHYIYVNEIGHGIQGDFSNRAGGLGLVKLISWSFSINNPMPSAASGRPGGRAVETERIIARTAIEASSMREGDVLMVCSVSGRNIRPIEAALTAHEIGAKVIAMTSVDYAKEVPSLHPSGKSLRECADWVIDLMTPYGDACMDIPGYPNKVVPISGVSEDVTGWMLWGRVMEIMGTLPEEERPIVFMSANRAGGMDAYMAARAKYDKRGY